MKKIIPLHPVKANEYNKKIARLEAPFVNYDKITGYETALNISGTGIMGYIELY